MLRSTKIGETTMRGVALKGSKVRGLRVALGKMQVDLAAAASVSVDTIGRAEGGRSISVENAAAIASALGVPIGELVAASVEADPPPPLGRHGLDAAASNIPIRVPVHFMGREEALADIETAMGRFHGRVAITALHGLRGVGKTVLAAAYAERHRGDYRATWWLRAETEAGMRADLVGLGVRLGWVGADDKEEPALAAVIERLGHEGDGILLIFDNAVDADSLAPYLPRGGAARVLVTSNYHAWRGTAEPVEIRLWPKEIGADYLVARTGREGERQAAEDLSVALGGLPLAHEQAAAYCERLEVSLAEYARRFAAEPARLLDTDRDAPAGYHDKLTVAKTFALAIEAASKLHPAVSTLIAFCALLEPEPIPLFVFAETREVIFTEPVLSALAGDGMDEAIAAMLAFGLVYRETIADERDPTITTESIRFHRLVREVAASLLPGKAADLVWRGLVTALFLVYPKDIYDNPGAWSRARRLDALTLALVGGDAVLPAGFEPRMAHLIDCLASYREVFLGDYGAAFPLYARALTINSQARGPEHPATITSANNLANLLVAMGNLPIAQKLFKRTLRIGTKINGATSLETAKYLNNLALTFKMQGDLVRAERLYKRALVIKKKILSSDDPGMVVSLGNLAGVRAARGYLAEANQLYKQALEISATKLGPTHPVTANSLNILAENLREQGDLTGARPLLDRALVILEKELGTVHPRTVLVRKNLSALIEQGG